jgi:alpha-tubulin suppressor-like RCC1 family protein
VCNFTDLLELGAVAAGTLVFVQDVAVPVIYNNGRWLGLDGRVFINTSSVTVMWTWGCNNFGVLGNSSIVDRSSPGTTVGGATGWCQASAGAQFVGAIQNDRSLWVWGRGDSGQIGNATTTASQLTPTTTCGTGWCRFGAGTDFSTAVKTDGTLWTWGSNNCGQLGTGNTAQRSSPGTTAGGGTSWCDVSGGNLHITAVKTDGTLWTWGRNTCGQLGDNSVTTRSSPGTTAGGGRSWCQVSSGYCFTAAVKIDGTLWTWGSNLCGILGTSTTVSRSSPGQPAGGGTTWCQVSVRQQHAGAVKTDGTLWTWGNNFNGQLGTNSATNRSSPGTTAGGGTTWCQISLGSTHTAAVKTDGTLWTWGENTCGRLGDGTTTVRSSPVITVGGGTTWCQAVSGTANMVAITVTRGA